MKVQALHHYAEPYAAQGNIDARAASRAIGKPQMDPWDVFLRETVQNSWDARIDPQGGVTYSVDAFWPSPEQVSLLTDVVFRDRLSDSPLAEFLAAHIDEQPVLVVTDRGTKGLGGGTRADRVDEPGETRDFVDFVRNVGRAADKALGGGTYGFGKGILWQVSNCSTVVVYSRTVHRGIPVSRLIAIGHTDSYSVGRTLFTGRHWWGQAHPETKLEPITGAAADELAAQLGMTRLRDGETGTAIMVLEPMASETAETLDDIVARIAGAALWWAWPHMVDRTIQFEFSCDGEDVEALRPECHPLLQHFAAAYSRAAAVDSEGASWPWHHGVVMMQRPELRLGALVWRNLQVDDLQHADDDRVEIRSHLALMRQPRLIVKYMDVKPNPHGLGTVGVFVADGRLNDDFARAEPVAHDDWQPNLMGLEKGARNPVRRALENIKQTFQVAALVVPPEDSVQVRRKGLVHLATSIGDLVVGSGDASIVERQPSRGGGSGSRKPVARVVGRPELQLVEGERVARFKVEVRIPEGGTLPVRVLAVPKVLTENGSEDATEDAPTIRGWRINGAIDRSGGHEVTIETHGAHEIEVMVAIPADTAATLVVTATEDAA